MKYLVYILGFGLMLWALFEQTKEQPNIYIQIVAVVVFFLLMMQLMNKIPSNSKRDINSNDDENVD